MRKYLAITIALLTTTGSLAQVGIGTENPHPTSELDIIATNKGVLLPNVALQSRVDKTTVENPVDGIMVFNTTTLNGDENTELKPGIYFWLTDRWVPNTKGELVEVTTNGNLVSYLGYEANGVHNANAFTLEGVTFARGASETTGYGCKQWSGNGHWYCGYRGSKAFNWQTAFNASKSRGGYLVTFTSLAEWEWVRTNIINNNTGYNLSNSIWIGYNKVNFSGNPTEFTWITGEKSKVNWSNQTETEHFFNSGEPNNSGGNEGCVHIINASNSSNRNWNDINCTNTNVTGEWAIPFRDLIIEFNQ